MEFGFLAIVASSVLVGLLLGRRVSRALGHIVLAVGLGSLIVALVVLGLTVVGWGPLGAWTAGLVAVLLLGMAGAAVPFGLTVSCGRSSSGSDAP